MVAEETAELTDGGFALTEFHQEGFDVRALGMWAGPGQKRVSSRSGTWLQSKSAKKAR